MQQVQFTFSKQSAANISKNVKKLPVRKLQISDGMVPERLLSWKVNTVMVGKAPNVDGIVPVKAFECNVIRSKLNMVPNSDGISPERELLWKNN